MSDETKEIAARTKVATDWLSKTWGDVLALAREIGCQPPDDELADGIGVMLDARDAELARLQGMLDNCSAAHERATAERDRYREALEWQATNWPGVQGDRARAALAQGRKDEHGD